MYLQVVFASFVSGLMTVLKRYKFSVKRQVFGYNLRSMCLCWVPQNIFMVHLHCGCIIGPCFIAILLSMLAALSVEHSKYNSFEDLFTLLLLRCLSHHVKLLI